MCIQTKIQQKLQQKAELDAQIAKLEQLELKTSPVKTLLAELLADYATEAPEDLAAIWQEVLAIGQKFDLSVQPLAVEELQQWEVDRRELEKLKLASEVWRQQLEEAEVEITEQDKAWGELSDERDDLEKELAKLRSQLQQVQTTSEVSQNLTERALKLDKYCTQCVESDNFAGFVQKIQHIVAGNELSPDQQIETQVLTEEKSAIGQELENLYQEALVEPEYEPEEATVTVENVLKSHGFFMPDINLGDCYSSVQKYEDYRSWEIYRSCQDKGIDGIGLYTEQFGFWDASTDMIDEDDPTFPQDFTDGDGILAWTRKVIDEVIAVTPIESSEVPGQLALEFPQPGSESTELQKLLVGNCNFTFEDLGVSVAAESVMIEQEIEIDGSEDGDDDSPATEEVEEVLFTVTNAEGQTRKYYHDAEELVRGCRHLTTCIIFTAEQYANKFLQDLKKDAKIKEKIARWNADETLISNQTTPEPMAQEVDTERYRNFNQIFGLQDFEVDVRQHNNGDEFAGASFNFYKIRENGATICAENLTYSKSLTAVECADKHPKALATEIIETYWQKLREEEERRANPYKKPEDDFIELVKLTPAVGYDKRRDNGELISAYAAFANRDAAGQKTATLAKPRAKKWAEHLHASFESCGWKVEEPRKATRMVAESGAKQQFAYEIKIGGKFSIGQLQLLAEEDFSLLPNEVAAVKVPAALPTTAAPIYSVKVNGYEVATGSEEEMRVRFEEELKTFGEEGRDAIRLIRGNEIIDEWYLSEFAFVPAQDFDETNPEYRTLHTPTKTNFRVYRSLASGAAWVNSVYPYSALSTKEAAAVDAVRRQLKAGKTE